VQLSPAYRLAKQELSQFPPVLNQNLNQVSYRHSNRSCATTWPQGSIRVIFICVTENEPY